MQTESSISSINKDLHQEEPAHDPNFDHSSSSSECSKDLDHEGRFFDRLNSIPIVAESLCFVNKYANDDQNAYARYLKYALSQAEAGFNKVTHIAEAKFPSQINAADQMAVSTLDYIEEKFPSVKSTTSSDVYKSSRQAFSGMVASPQAALNSTIDSIATNAEFVLDRFLPPGEEVDTSDKDSGVARLRDVGVDASRRLSQAVRTQFDTISSNGSQVPILNLKEANKIIERATQEFASLNEKLVQVVSQTKDNVIQYKDSSMQFIQESQSTLITRLTTEYETASNYFKTHAGSMPESVRARLEPSIKFLNERYAKVSTELQNNDHSPTEKARTALLLATDSVPYLEDVCKYLSAYLAPARI